MGKSHTSYKFNETKDKRYKIYCGTCENETNHIVLQSVERYGYEEVYYHDNDPNKPETIKWEDRYQIVQCQGCDTISFRHLNWFSEYQEYWGPDDFNDGTTTLQYPKRDKNTIPVKNYYNVPTSIRRLYRESVDCLNNDSTTLCAAGLRSIVEGICADQGVLEGPVEETKSDGTVVTKRKKDLRARISGLNEKGILTKKNSEILNEHRYLGNEAAHELSRPSIEELKLAIEIIEHTLEALYEIPEKATDLNIKRAKRNKT